MLGGVTRLVLPLLPGVPHLPVNRPLENTTTKPRVMSFILQLYAGVKTCAHVPMQKLKKIKNFLQIDIFCKFYSNIAYLV